MSEKLGLSQFISPAIFQRLKSAFSTRCSMPLEICDNSGGEIKNLCNKNCYPEFCRQIKKTRLGKKKCSEEKLRAVNIAIETGQPYITICHAGIAFVCVPVMEKDIPLGGLFFGRCLFEKPSKILENEIAANIAKVVANQKQAIAELASLEIVPPRKFFEIANYLFVLLYEITGLDPAAIKWRNLKSQQQSQIGEYIRKYKAEPNLPRYPYNYEQQLMEKVKIGDKAGTRDTLNCMLATIILQNSAQLDVLKARLFELLSLLSRAAVEGGADVNVLLAKNLEHIQKLMKIDNQPDLCAWTSRAIDEFTELVYAVGQAKKAIQIRPAIDYIEKNYQKPISLCDVASAVHLSVSRLAHIFKEQLGFTVVDYITKVRIDKAKQLLLYTEKNCTQICFEVGYNNQSYFTRTFRDVVSVSPVQFRKLNKRLPLGR